MRRSVLLALVLVPRLLMGSAFCVVVPVCIFFVHVLFVAWLVVRLSWVLLHVLLVTVPGLSLESVALVVRELWEPCSPTVFSILFSLFFLFIGLLAWAISPLHATPRRRTPASLYSLPLLGLFLLSPLSHLSPLALSSLSPFLCALKIPSILSSFSFSPLLVALALACSLSPVSASLPPSGGDR